MSNDSVTPRIDGELSGLVEFMERKIPFNAHLGIRVDELHRGTCVLRIPFADFLIGDPFRPAIHGGVLSSLADTAGGAACFSMFNSAADRVSTVDIRLDFLQPGATGADLFCRAEVLRMGNKVGVTRMEIFGGALPRDSKTDPIASGRGVYSLLRRSE